MKNWITSVISVFAIIISIIAIANVAPTKGVDFDYLGAIIGVLAFLVTLLMGYQIYTVINVKEELKEVQKARDEIDSKIDKGGSDIKESVTKDMKQLLPLLLTVDSRDPYEIINSALEVHQRAEKGSLPEIVSDGLIAVFMNRISDYIKTDKEDVMKELTGRLDKKLVVDYYSHYLGKTDKEKEESKNAESVLLMLISSLNKKGGNVNDGSAK